MSKSIFLSSSYKLNNIYNVDCFELFSKIKDNTVDLVFADPPYNLSKSDMSLNFVKTGGKLLSTNKGEWDHFSSDAFEDFNHRWLAESFRILKPTGAIWVSGTYHNIYQIGFLMKKLKYELLNEIIWYKVDATPNLSCTRFVADHENFIWARKGKGNTFHYREMKELNGGTQMRSTWMSPKRLDDLRIHPTQKPCWILERIIRATTNPDDIILDPFMGSATTAVVAKKMHRNFIGSEKNYEFFQKAQKRLLCIN